MKSAVLYTTFADLDQVRTFAAAVLEAKLAACVNALPAMRSFYRWEDIVREDAEVACIIKTRLELKDALMTFAKAEHPYDTPALLWFEADAGDPDFAAWIGAETGA